MPLRDDPIGQIATKAMVTTYEKFLAIVLLLVLILLGANFSQNVHTQHQNNKIIKVQADGVVRGYVNRAISCDVAKAIGADEPQHCEDEVIQPYRDKNLVAGSTASAKASKHTLAVMCAVIQQSALPQSVKNICLGD